MKNPVLIGAMTLILGGSIAAYFYWQNSQLESAPVLVQVPTPSLRSPKPEVRQEVVAAPPSTPPLPALADSDNFMLDALAGLVGNKSLMMFFHNDRIIHDIVATIDNLPTSHAPMGVMPVIQAPGDFITAGKNDDLIIGARNASRYTPYVRIAEAIDAKKLVEVYIRLYPLFQQAYEKLGYPNKYFNDRLIHALDNLLETPIIKEPVRLVRPNVLYLFADPDIEERSIGQKILMRTGSKSEAIIKSKLREIKQELMLHMHERKVPNSE